MALAVRKDAFMNSLVIEEAGVRKQVIVCCAFYTFDFLQLNLAITRVEGGRILKQKTAL